MRQNKLPNPYVPYSKSLGDFLRERRLHADLSQGDLAKALSYGTNQVVSNWERGIQSPPFSKLLELCSILKISQKEMLQKLLTEQQKIYTTSISLIRKRRS